jgi:hypothetical protein
MPTQQSYTLASPTSKPTSQSLQKSMPAPRQDKLNIFLPSLRCFNFFATHSRHISSWTETAKIYSGQGLTMTEDRRPACNSTYPKGGVSCSKESFVVNQTLVFQIKFGGKSPALRVAANRYMKLLKGIVHRKYDYHIRSAI